MLEAALLYHWLRMATLIHGVSEETFNAFSKHMEKVAALLIAVLKKAAAEIQDAGPTPAMQELGEQIQEVRERLGLGQKQPLSRQEAEWQADTANRRLFKIAKDCLQNAIHPAFIESAFLYHWLRVSTMNANVSEGVFQKLDRNWPVVIDRVREIVKKLPQEMLEK